jgi:hypothetical protein
VKKKQLFIALCMFSFVGTFMSITKVNAAKPSTSGTATTISPLGIDISWPQCQTNLPTTQAFGIVGVNGGLATTTNPCLKDQLIWANKSIGGANQEKLQLYVNTANPGGLGTVSWPSSNIDPQNNATRNPYGLCDNKDTKACAWQYGWNRSVEAVHDRFTPAAVQAGIDSKASTYIWWLDVETENTWKLGGTDFDNESNVAVLEGMTAYYLSINARVGLYSTGSQWSQIVGNAVSSTSNLNGLNNWRPGGANLKTAKQACTAQPLTKNGKIVLTQFISRGLDYNYSCI